MVSEELESLPLIGRQLTDYLPLLSALPIQVPSAGSLTGNASLWGEIRVYQILQLCIIGTLLNQFESGHCSSGFSHTDKLHQDNDFYLLLSVDSFEGRGHFSGCPSWNYK